MLFLSTYIEDEANFVVRFTVLIGTNVSHNNPKTWFVLWMGSEQKKNVDNLLSENNYQLTNLGH